MFFKLSRWMHVSYDGQSMERISVYNKDRNITKREIRREERIVGGAVTNIQQHPFYASLYLNGNVLLDSYVLNSSLQAMTRTCAGAH